MYTIEPIDRKWTPDERSQLALFANAIETGIREFSTLPKKSAFVVRDPDTHQYHTCPIGDAILAKRFVTAADFKGVNNRVSNIDPAIALIRAAFPILNDDVDVAYDDVDDHVYGGVFLFVIYELFDRGILSKDGILNLLHQAATIE